MRIQKGIFRGIILPLTVAVIGVVGAVNPENKALMVIFWLIVGIFGAFNVDWDLKEKNYKQDFSRVWIRWEGEEWIGPFDNIDHVNSYITKYGLSNKYYIMTSWDYIKEVMSDVSS